MRGGETRVLSSVCFAGVNIVESFLGGACPASLNLQQRLDLWLVVCEYNIAVTQLHIHFILGVMFVATCSLGDPVPETQVQVNFQEVQQRNDSMGKVVMALDISGSMNVSVP